MKDLLNKKEVDKWCFNQCKKGNTIIGVKGLVGGKKQNIGFECVETKERIYLHWKNSVLG